MWVFVLFGFDLLGNGIGGVGRYGWFVGWWFKSLDLERYGCFVRLVVVVLDFVGKGEGRGEGALWIPG